MGFLIMLAVVGMFWAIISKEDDLGFFGWLAFTIGTFIVLSLLVFVIGFGYTDNMERDIKVDNISLVGDSYIVEQNGKTESFKRNELPIDIGDESYVTYSRSYSEKNLFNDFFGFTDEQHKKDLSDEKFIKEDSIKASVVKIGIKKENIK